jgi:D-glycero-D-manno-heptose 1,7-bisphosphate phosphatase
MRERSQGRREPPGRGSPVRRAALSRPSRRGSGLELRTDWRPAVFLDRDGTLIEERDYIRRPDQVRVYRRVPPALRLLRAAGFRLIVVTNQSGLARGYFTARDLARVHRRMSRLLRGRGARVDAIYVCPHHPEDRCSCRKPAPGLVRKACRDFPVDLRRSFMVGDSPRDVEAGRRMRLATARVRTGYGRRPGRPRADYHGRDLLDVARWILKRIRRMI